MEGLTVAFNVVSAKFADFREVSGTVLRLGHRSFTDTNLYCRPDFYPAHLPRLRTGMADVIAFVIEWSFDNVMNVLGILRAGAGYAPVDATMPQLRMGFAAGDSVFGILTGRTTLLNRRLTPACIFPGNFLRMTPRCWTLSRPWDY